MEIATARLLLLSLALELQPTPFRCFVGLVLASALLFIAPLGVGHQDHPGHDVVQPRLEGAVWPVGP
jgi:hypothetical protein